MATVATKHKTFISYHHDSDQGYKDNFEKKFEDIFINKSVCDGDIKEDVSTEYIKKLIQNGYLKDSSVLVVLIGSETYKRKHVDWEISAALSSKVGGCSGLIGIILPSYYDDKQNQHLKGQNKHNSATIPPRLNDNVESGYAVLYRWESAISKDDKGEFKIKKWIDEAFVRKNNNSKLIDNSRKQFINNR